MKLEDLKEVNKLSIDLRQLTGQLELVKKHVTKDDALHVRYDTVEFYGLSMDADRFQRLKTIFEEELKSRIADVKNKLQSLGIQV